MARCRGLAGEVASVAARLRLKMNDRILISLEQAVTEINGNGKPETQVAMRTDPDLDPRAAVEFRCAQAGVKAPEANRRRGLVSSPRKRNYAVALRCFDLLELFWLLFASGSLDSIASTFILRAS